MNSRYLLELWRRELNILILDMQRFITAVFLLTLVASAAALGSESIRQMIEEKTRLAKTSLNGGETHPIIRAHGSGITDGQEAFIINFIDQAAQSYGGDLYSNAVYIQQKIEDSFSDRWNVEIFRGISSVWGRLTYIQNQRWILLFDYGDNDWDYIIWVSDC
jgi:hypothetical protein